MSEGIQYLTASYNEEYAANAKIRGRN